MQLGRGVPEIEVSSGLNRLSTSGLGSEQRLFGDTRVHRFGAHDRYCPGMAYEVHLGVYDGPFSLLLQLITAEEVDVYAVSLTDIVDAFLTELHRLETVDLDLATEFLLIASTLVELKCRRLLPGSAGTDLDEDFALFEARDYLLARLVECKTFTGAAESLAALEVDASRSITRRIGPDDRFEHVAADLLANVTPSLLLGIARRALRDRPVPVIATGHIHDDEISVAETLDNILGILPERGRMSMRQLTSGDRTRPRFVATFLALLELYKRELVDLEQASSFGELVVVWVANGPVESFNDVESYDDVSSLRS